MINIRQKNIALDAVDSYRVMLDATGWPEPMLTNELTGIFEAVYCMGFNDTHKQLTCWANNNLSTPQDRAAIKRVLELLKEFGLQY